MIADRKTVWTTPPRGSRIRLISMPNDPMPIQPGTEGTVGAVITGHTGSNGVAQVWVEWDNGRTLNLIPDLDHWEVLDG